MSEKIINQHVRKDSSELVRTYADRDPNEILSEIIGPEFDEYRRAFEAATNFELETKVPLHIDFEINYACNLKCPTCIFDLPIDQRPTEPAKGLGRKLSMEAFQKVIKEGVPLGLRSIGVTYYNEPFLRKDCLDMIEWAMDNGIIDVHLSTNATLLNDELSNRILKLKIPRFSFSLDGVSKETFEKVRKGANRDEVYKNINRFLELKKQGGYQLPLTRVAFVRSILNEHELDDFNEYWKDKADYIAIQEYVTMTPGQSHLKPKSHQSSVDFKCPQPNQRLIIRSDGVALPCCISYGTELPMGNIQDKTLEEIWNSEKMVDLRQMHKEGRYQDNPTCKKCAKYTTG